MESKQDYEAFFRLSARPFSLTPDPRFYFRSRSHGRVFDTLSAAITRRECLMLVVGDLGVGKTTLCRTVIDLQARKSRAALLGNALQSSDDLLRLMLQDLGAVSPADLQQGRLASATRAEMVAMFDSYLQQLRAADASALMIVDEAHNLPAATTEQILEIASLESNRDHTIQFLLAGQPTIGGGGILPRSVDDRLAVRARLLPLERDECERYLLHRLTIAGGQVTFSPRAVDVIYTLSGGLPRLVNLLGDRALQEAAAAHATHVEPTMIESAAAALDLLRLKPKRFRWYGTR
jgi:general secretion pathway protein A